MREDRLRELTGHETHELRRALKRSNRRRSERILLLAIVLGPIFLYVAYELGHSLFYMQDVKTFVSTIDQRTPAEVKAEVRRLAHGLHSTNPLIRDASMAAMKVATGWNLGTDASEWKRWWAEQEPVWEYRGAKLSVPKPATPDWRSNLPPAALESPATP